PPSTAAGWSRRCSGPLRKPSAPHRDPCARPFPRPSCGARPTRSAWGTPRWRRPLSSRRRPG
ncbi:unnamed protein product, partial [Heterosigma akashiwo]